MTAVALAESGGRPDAHATSGEDSRGIFQINVAAHPQLDAVTLYDPAVNARYAYEISAQGTNISPWSTTHRDRGMPYAKFQADVQAAAVRYGDPAAGGMWQGSAGYGTVAPAAGGGVGAEAEASATASIDPPAPPVDTSVAEPPVQLHGLDARVAGELRSGVNPYLVDSGHRGMSDGLAHAIGDPGSGAGDALLRGFHAEYVAEHSVGHAASGLLATPSGTPAPAAPLDATSAPLPTGGAGADPQALTAFMHAAESELGSSYVFAAKADASVDHPKALDCSGLTAWAAARAGVHIPDGAAHQYLYLKGLGTTIPVEQAKHTPGALMFTFDGEPPPNMEPEIAHVVISDGNGGTIEAMDPADGVLRSKAGTRFNFAALIPGITTPMLSAGGNPALPTPDAGAAHDDPGQVDTFLNAIRAHESGGDYQAHSPAGGAHGAYQFIDSTWAAWCDRAGYHQYAGGHASDAPPAVQDAVAKAMALSAYSGTHDWGAVACIWYIGHPPQGAEWNTVPKPEFGNTITPRQYADDVLSRMKMLGATPTGPSLTTTAAATIAPTAVPGRALSPAEIVAAELKSGANPFASDQGHTGVSDGLRMIASGKPAPLPDHTDSDLVRGFQQGYTDAHSQLPDDHH
jgi:hypothetical protein